jgi:hypothetical protein
MQIQLKESRFGVRPGEMRESKASNRERRRVKCSPKFGPVNKV